MSGGSLTPEAVAGRIEQVEAEGFTVIRGNDKLILLDLDTPEAARRLLRAFPMMDELGLGSLSTRYTAWRSKSGNGWHVTIDCYIAYPPLEIAAFQSLLGSDNVKEILFTAAIALGMGFQANLLFRPPGAKVFKGDWDLAPDPLYNYAHGIDACHPLGLGDIEL